MCLMSCSYRHILEVWLPDSQSVTHHVLFPIIFTQWNSKCRGQVIYNNETSVCLLRSIHFIPPFSEISTLKRDKNMYFDNISGNLHFSYIIFLHMHYRNKNYNILFLLYIATYSCLILLKIFLPCGWIFSLYYQWFLCQHFTSILTYIYLSSSITSLFIYFILLFFIHWVVLLFSFHFFPILYMILFKIVITLEYINLITKQLGPVVDL